LFFEWIFVFLRMDLGRRGVFFEGEYRYGFQNQEKDDEVKGAGNSVNYKYRMHSLYRLFGNPDYKKYIVNYKIGATFITAIGGKVQMWQQDIDAPALIVNIIS
jgi:hypothetical protein